MFYNIFKVLFKVKFIKHRQSGNSKSLLTKFSQETFDCQKVVLVLKCNVCVAINKFNDKRKLKKQRGNRKSFILKTAFFIERTFDLLSIKHFDGK